MTKFRPYLVTGILIAIIVIVGFWPSYFGLIMAGTLDVAPIVHLHTFIFLGWVTLLIIQTSLVAIGRTDLHRKLGAFGIVLGIALIVMGIVVTLNRVAIGIEAGHVLKAQQFMLIPLTDIILFSGFFIAAVINRKTPEIHKRLMLIATVALLDTPVSRMKYLGEPLNPALFLLIWFVPLFFLLIADFVQTRKITWLYVFGLVILLISGLRVPISQTEAWLSVARLITGSS